MKKDMFLNPNYKPDENTKEEIEKMVEESEKYKLANKVLLITFLAREAQGQPRRFSSIEYLARHDSFGGWGPNFGTTK